MLFVLPKRMQKNIVSMFPKLFSVSFSLSCHTASAATIAPKTTKVAIVNDIRVHAPSVVVLTSISGS